VIAETIAQKKNILKSRIFWVGIVLVGLVFSAQWGSGKLRAIYAVSERSSIASRLMIWKTAGKLAHDNPVWGIGPGNFQNKYLEYQKFFPPYLEWAVSHPHNIFLAFFLYSGLAGTTGFVMLVFFWFRDILKKEDSALKTIFLGVMIYALLHGLVDTTYFKNDLAVIFWLSFSALNLKKAS
ncbi:MAG TPA: O-antigen ligase family protein, partial [Patescibacteria group bacterium]